MKLALLIVSLFSFFTVFSQNEGSVNQIDSRGLKQGAWEYFKMDTLAFENLRTYKIDTVVRKKMWKKGNYVDSKKHGIWKVYTYDLRKKRPENEIVIGDLLYEVTLKNGVMSGPLKVYQKDGIKCLTTVRDGLIKGIFMEFHANGKMKYKGVIDQDQAFFDGTEYYETGAKYRDRKFNTEIIINQTIDIERVKRELDL
jgi:antitoxin component YwqK of YwqJK toxin-antitoxin module